MAKHREVHRPLRALWIGGGVLLAGYVACTPDVDELSTEYGRAGSSGSAGQQAGGTGGTPGTAGGGTAGDIAIEGGTGGGVEPVAGAGGMGGIAPQGGSGGVPDGQVAGASGAAGAGGTGGVGGEGGAAGGGTGCENGLISCPGEPVCSIDAESGTPTENTVTNCGDCGTTCSVVNATSATCSGGTCEPTCEDGFDDCNAATSNDGCESNLLTSVTACGSCDRACSRFGATATACVDAICEPTCAPKYLNCSEDDGTEVDDGCETYLDALDACGTACGETVACAASEVCNLGVCGDAQGLVVFTVPFTMNGQIQRYADRFVSLAPNLTNTILTVRAYAPGARGGSLNIYVSDQSFDAGSGPVVQLAQLANRWTDIAVPIGDVSGNFDPSFISQVNLEVNADAPGPWATPTVVYIDAIWSANGAITRTYDTTLTDMVRSSALQVAGSTLTWSDALP